jgi:hypothetical protein
VIFAQMVDDPSAYVDTLLGDPTLKRRAESELRQRHAAWLGFAIRGQAFVATGRTQ